MPWIQRMAAQVNRRFSREFIDEVDLGMLGPGIPLAEIAKGMGIATSPPEETYLNSWPAAQQEAVRAALYSALNRERRMPVTFAWTPGYDFKLTIYETAGTEQSEGGMTILMESRYPGDEIGATLTERGAMAQFSERRA